MTTDTLYPYFCGEASCCFLRILTMNEITDHWRSHRNGDDDD